MAENKTKNLIKEIEKLSVVELNELVKALEEKFDIKAAPPVAGPAAVANAAPPAGEQPEEKAVVSLILKTSGDNKISVIKAVRQVKSDLGLKEAKDLVESLPQELLKEVDRKEAEQAKKVLEQAGATAELK